MKQGLKYCVKLPMCFLFILGFKHKETYVFPYRKHFWSQSILAKGHHVWNGMARAEANHGIELAKTILGRTFSW